LEAGEQHDKFPHLFLEEEEEEEQEKIAA